VVVAAIVVEVAAVVAAEAEVAVEDAGDKRNSK